MASSSRPSESSASRWRPPGFADWFGELGSAVSELGNSIFDRREVGECRSDATVLGGYSLISARVSTRRSPSRTVARRLLIGGGVEVGQITFLAAGDRGEASRAEAAVS
jgi:hypothetical protein